MKVIFPLVKDEDGYPPVDVEGVWATPLGGNRYEVDNVPFFVRGISNEDIVIAEPDARGELRFVGLNRASAHTTLRVIVFRQSPDPRPVEERVRELRQRIVELGCSSEVGHIPGLVAIDVPPTSSLEPVRKILAGGPDNELWDYEEAAIRH